MPSTRTTSRRGLGFTWKPGRHHVDRPRRLRHLLRQDHDRSRPSRSCRQASTADSFTVTFPTSSADPGPESAASCRPIPFWSTDRSSIGPRSTRCSRPGRSAATPARSSSTIPTGGCRGLTSCRSATSGSLASRWPSPSTTSRAGTAISSINFDLNPGRVRTRAAPGRITLHRPRGHRRSARHLAVRQPGAHPVKHGSSDFDGVNFSLEKRYSNRWAGRVSYAVGYARGNAEANQRGFNNYQVGADPNLRS